jgi:hypothetical protein
LPQRRLRLGQRRWKLVLLLLLLLLWLLLLCMLVRVP